MTNINCNDTIIYAYFFIYYNMTDLLIYYTYLITLIFSYYTSIIIFILFFPHITLNIYLRKLLSIFQFKLNCTMHLYVIAAYIKLTYIVNHNY